MKYEFLSESVSVKRVSETDREGVFEVEGLYRGYGLTLGTTLRRVLLSSLPGAAITQIKIKGVHHEFSTIPGVLEDAVAIMLNLKQVRFRIHTTEPQVLTLKARGEREVLASDIETNAEVELITPDAHVATLTEKGAELDMELTVEKGLGYVPVEARKTEKLPIGVIALDAIFTPVTKAFYTVENMRVGDRTDYNRLRFHIETDGSITPSQAFRKASKILEDHFVKASQIEAREPAPVAPAAPAKKRATARVKKASATKKRASKKEEKVEAAAGEVAAEGAGEAGAAPAEAEGGTNENV